MPGQVLRLDERASVQFAGDRSIVLRVITVDPRPTYEGWVWLSGYELDGKGSATVRREVFVRVCGLRPVTAGRVGRR